MIGIYFSGTGNSKYCVEKFLKAYNDGGKAFAIEEKETLEQIRKHDELVICYPVQFSNLPKILYDYIIGHQEVWQNKRIFVMATMGLFSGDGAGVLARLLRRYGAVIVGGLHLKMPDSICDEKALKRTPKQNKALLIQAEQKISKAVKAIKVGKAPQEGLSLAHRILGFLGQRLLFGHKTKHYTDRLKINQEKCVGCGLCIKVCPMKNIYLETSKARAKDQCTMCYRCISKCPKQAITLLGKEVIKQNNIKTYE